MISQWIDKSKKNDQNFQRKGDHQVSRDRKRRKKKKKNRDRDFQKKNRRRKKSRRDGKVITDGE